MNVNIKNRSKIVSLLLIFSASLSVNAASIEKDSVGGEINNLNLFNSEKFDLDKGLSYIEAKDALLVGETEQVSRNYRLVVELIKDRKLKEANIKLMAFIQQSPEVSNYYDLKALLSLIDKDFVSAETSFLKALDLNPKNSSAYRGLTKLFLAEKKIDKARYYAAKAVDLYPGWLDAYKLLAEVYMHQQGIEAAEKVLLDAKEKVKGRLIAELEIVNLLGKIYSIKNEPKKVLYMAEDLFEKNQRDISVLSFLAGAQLINKNEHAAEKTLRLISDLYPKDVKHRVLLARLLAKQAGQEKEILRLLDEAASNTDKMALILSYKVGILINQKQLQKALIVAEKIDVENPELNLGKLLKGDVYFSQKKYMEALQSYKQAYDITPSTKLLDAQLNILTLLNKQQDLILLLEKELKKNKENKSIQYRLAVAYQKAGKNELAIKHYEALRAVADGNIIVLNNLAWVYSLQKKYVKALELAKEAYIKAPDSAVIVDTYGYILLQNGNKKESLGVLKKAEKLDSKLTDIQVHLAESYIANGDKQKAKDILHKVLKKEGSNHSKARKMMNRL